MNKIETYLASFFNIIAIWLLCCACLAQKVDPRNMSFLSIFGLTMPYAIILNLLFVLYWILKARFYASWSIITLIITWSIVKISIPYEKASEAPVESSFTVMSYNVRVFDRYNWSENKSNVHKMLEYIKEEDADIICFQEFGTSKTGITEEYILKTLSNHPYNYIKYAPSKSSSKHRTGMAIISKYPLSKRGIKGDPTMRKGSMIFANALIKGKPHNIINAHFESIHITDKYDIIKVIDSENYKNKINGVIKSYNNSSRIHAGFAEQVKYVIGASDYPCILCVDLNNTPISYCYNTISKELKDSYLQDGIGFGSTYNGNYPFLRIDYIFHDEQIPVKKFKRDRVNFSDHYPIIAEFESL